MRKGSRGKAPGRPATGTRCCRRRPSWTASRSPAPPAPTPRTQALCAQAARGDGLDESEITELFAARGDDLVTVLRAADALRREVNGDDVTYVVNRNINYTNVCYFRCRFCAFSKGKLSENLRGAPYDLDLDEIARRSAEAWERGATEVCMQGGIHPEYTGATYLEICRTVKAAVPGMHVHAFSPLEVWQGAATLGLSLDTFLRQLRAAGLATLPGTAAEVLDDEVRRELCPDKLSTGQWLEVMETAHRVGFRTTATIMYGHIDRPRHWARHLLRIRELQTRTGGFTEFVPLPFVHMEAPIYLKGQARRGPTFRESLLMHAVARLALHPLVPNIQASWVKLGPRGVRACLGAGVNDLGGTLMNESITRAAGAGFGQELAPERMEALICGAGRSPRQRSTTYGEPPEQQVARSFHAADLRPIVQTPNPCLGAGRRAAGARQAGTRGAGGGGEAHSPVNAKTEWGGEPMTDGPVGALRTKLLQRTTLIAAAAVVVVLAGGFLAWSATCPCERTPGAWLFGTVQDEAGERLAVREPGHAVPDPDPHFGLLPHAINLNCFRHQRRRPVPELLELRRQALVRHCASRRLGPAAARRRRLPGDVDARAGPGRARPGLGRPTRQAELAGSARQSAGATRHPAPGPLVVVPRRVPQQLEARLARHELEPDGRHALGGPMSLRQTSDRHIHAGDCAQHHAAHRLEKLRSSAWSTPGQV